MGISQEIRDALHKRAGGLCECEMKVCGHVGRCSKPLGTRWEAHHKISVAAGGTNSLSNLVAMCEDCHKNTYTYGKH
ncbi:MAG: hypothetical protein Kow0098_03420 [Ignavibacteriaceae bacterium]